MKTFFARHGWSYGLVTFGMIARAAIQAVIVVFLGRLLGVHEYGVYVAVLSVTGFFSVLAGLGASALHLRDTARNPEVWRNSYATHFRSILRSQPWLMAVCLPVAWLVAQRSADGWEIFLIVVGDLVGLASADLLVRSYQGRARFGRMALSMCALPGLRLVLLLITAWIGRLDMRLWAAFCFTSGLTMFAVSSVLAWGAKSGATPFSLGSENARFAGVGFALASASTRIHADADKAIIARLSSFGLAGEYSVAYRLMDLFLLPINSLIEWGAGPLFRRGQHGFIKSTAGLHRAALLILAAAVMVSAIAWLSAPWIPAIFGDAFENAVTMVHWLSFLPLTTAMWAGLRSVAATSGLERMVGLVEMLGAVTSALLAIALVMVMGWKGAALATYATHILMVTAVLIMGIKSSH